MLDAKLKNKIVSIITRKFKVKDIILFGSYASGAPHADSDIDIIIVLDETGFAKSYMEKVKRRVRVSEPLFELEEEFPIDLLVYTRDEWNRLVEVGSSFIRGIINNGVRLL
jgi:uncharacterized protein